MAYRQARRNIRPLLALGLAGLLFGCSLFQSAPPAAPTAEPKPKAALGDWGVDLSGIDPSVKPGDDFFRYVNGNWLKTAEIPADRSSIGSFTTLAIQNETRVMSILDDLKSKADLSDEERKIRDAYAAYIDVAKLEQLGLKPAAKDLATISAVKTHNDVARIMGSIPMGVDGVFNAGIGIDDKASDHYAIFLGQSGLGLPDRDYYLLDEKGTKDAREKYHAYIATMLGLGGVKDAKKKSDRIFALETEIAKLHWPADQSREADKIYNPMTLAELAKFAPRFPWAVFFGEMGVKGPNGGALSARKVVVAQKSAFPGLAALFAKTPVSTWKDYLTFHYLSSHASALPKRFDDANFDFYGKVLAGRTEQLAREKRGVSYLNGMLGEAVGKLYVARYFPPEAKAKAQELVGNLLKVYAQRIQSLTWLGEESKKKALDKVAHFGVKIGYPDKWRDYSKLEIVPGDLLGNSARGAVFEFNRDLVRLDDPVDRSEWGMTPQTVNAYNNFNLNEIVFPAAILQPPFFDPNADDAVNYGAIGAVIGHEISHGFDDQGSKYNTKGELEDWWTADDRAKFEVQTKALVGQYNQYSPIEGMKVNGQLTLGENIADFAGVTVAHAAYRLSLMGKEPPVLDGFNGDQRFFLGFGQVWRTKTRDATFRVRLLSDPHSPEMFRVNGVVRNVPEWYSDFNVMPGEALYLAPESRVKLW